MFEALANEGLRCDGGVKAAATLLGMNWEATHEIVKLAVERGLLKRDQEDIRYVGINEKSFGKGQDDRSQGLTSHRSVRRAN